MLNALQIQLLQAAAQHSVQYNSARIQQIFISAYMLQDYDTVQYIMQHYFTTQYFNAQVLAQLQQALCTNNSTHVH